MYTTKEQAEKLNEHYPEFYPQAANIAENFGIVPQQVYLYDQSNILFIGHHLTIEESKETFGKIQSSHCCESKLDKSSLYFNWI